MYTLINRKLFFILSILIGFISSIDLAYALTLEHRPYLQSGTTTGMTVRWRTDVISDTRLSYGTSPTTLNNVVDDQILKDEHIVSITGLTPDTKYYYSVGSSSQVLAGGDQNHYFMTAPVIGSNRPVKIWAVGDSGTANASARAVRDAYESDAGTAHTDVFLMLGDNAYNNGTDSEYTRAVFDMYPEMMRSTPTWATMGNHDSRTSNGGVMLGLFDFPKAGEAGGLGSGSERYYSYDFANVHFVVLDSQTSNRSTSGAMLTWLEQDLAMTNQHWIIAFWHHPPYTKGSHNSDSEGQLIDMRENALPILESYGVDIVLSGHSHSYERSFLLNGHYGKSGTLTEAMKIDGGSGQESGDGSYQKTGDEGAVYIVAGSSGKTSGVSRHNAMYVWLSRLGSVSIDVNDNRIDTRFINNTGTVEDNFTLIKGLPTVNENPGSNPDTDANLDNNEILQATTGAFGPIDTLFLLLVLLSIARGRQLK